MNKNCINTKLYLEIYNKYKNIKVKNQKYFNFIKKI
jgi:hypothetical protein